MAELLEETGHPYEKIPSTVFMNQLTLLYRDHSSRINEIILQEYLKPSLPQFEETKVTRSKNARAKNASKYEHACTSHSVYYKKRQSRNSRAKQLSGLSHKISKLAST